MALAATELLLTIPISSYAIYLNATAQPLEPWVSWSNTHYAFSRVLQIPSALWCMDHELVVALELGQWLNPVCALIFFAYFGLAGEARKNYKVAFGFITRKLGFMAVMARKFGVRPLGITFARFGRIASDVLPVYSPSSPSRYKTSESVASSLSEGGEKSPYFRVTTPPYLAGGAHGTAVLSSTPSVSAVGAATTAEGESLHGTGVPS